jgi:hypothetical protein
MTQFGRILSIAIFASVVWLIAPQNLRAQQQGSTCADWAVQAFSGTVTISGSGQSTTPDGRTYITSTNATFNITTSTGFTNCYGSPLGFAWDGLQNTATASALTVHDKFFQRTTDINGNPCTNTTSYDFSGSGTTSTPNAGFYIAANFATNTSGTYQLGDGFNVDGITVTVDESACGGPVQTSTSQLSVGPFAPTFFPQVPLPSTVGALTGSNSVQAPSFILFNNEADSNADSTWTVSWSLSPIPPALDVILSTLPDYSTWRPTAGLNETEIGGALLINAQLISKTTGQPLQIAPDQWTFALKDFSSEPGVSLNWPPANQALTLPDMDFKDPFNSTIYPGITLSNNGTSAQITPSASQGLLNSVELFLDSHDWGAWATLNVTASIGGQQISGHFQGDPTTDVLVPKRQTGSHVADVWKMQYNVPLSTPDNDDSELNPSSYPGCLGDGLTLYEEYRGFMENGKHIEGNPNTKDFFIENRIGADAEPGIFLFTELTGLNVHKNLQPNEVKIDHPNGQAGSMLINFNYAQGAHTTNQHGVTIGQQLFAPGAQYRQGMDGGATIPTDPSYTAYHFKPRIVDAVVMQFRDAQGTLNPSNTHKGVITASNALLQYDVGVAHEFLHSVGVDHHGDGDLQTETFKFVPPGSPGNLSDTAIFQLNGVPAHILNETTNQDLADLLWQKVQGAYTLCQGIVQFSVIVPNSIVEQCQYFLTNAPVVFSPTYYIGMPHGQHSGNDQCVMRYFFAQVYPAAPPAQNVFYAVSAGSEPVGSGLCDSAAGTGVNDPDRTPQPRYFDAQAGRGGCAFWICVSDNPNYPLVPNGSN